ncbi:hypothetical protein XENTR_v10014983 [Xenopus tropicalis]|nr:hypothetical protein XENTR_v10014983 [Xenopus tropicalis]
MGVFFSAGLSACGPFPVPPVLDSAPWLVVICGIAIVLSVLACPVPCPPFPLVLLGLCLSQSPISCRIPAINASHVAAPAGGLLL